MSLADIMLNERSQAPESVCTVPFMCGSGPAMVTVRKTLAPGRGILMEGACLLLFCVDLAMDPEASCMLEELSATDLYSQLCFQRLL